MAEGFVKQKVFKILFNFMVFSKQIVSVPHFNQDNCNSTCRAKIYCQKGSNYYDEAWLAQFANALYKKLFNFDFNADL